MFKKGNDFGGITIKSKHVIARAHENNYPIKELNGVYILTAPDGHKFFIINEDQKLNFDPVIKVALNVTNLSESKKYWNEILQMRIISEKEKNKLLLAYEENQAKLELIQINEAFNRAKAYGRIAFAVPLDNQPIINEIIKENKKTILTPLISLDTPGKATVRVIILADPDGHEICFVDEEGFSQLSQVEVKADESLTKFIEKDPFQNN